MVNWRGSVATAVFPLVPCNKSDQKKHAQNLAHCAREPVTTKAGRNYWMKRDRWTTIVKLCQLFYMAWYQFNHIIPWVVQMYQAPFSLNVYMLNSMTWLNILHTKLTLWHSMKYFHHARTLWHNMKYILHAWTFRLDMKYIHHAMTLWHNMKYIAWTLRGIYCIMYGRYDLTWTLLFSYSFIPESPRWLYLNGKSKQAEVIIRHAAKVNGVTLPDNLAVKVEVWHINLWWCLKNTNIVWNR